MNLEEAQCLAYSILIAKKGMAVGECAQKAAKLGGYQGDDLKTIEGGLIEFLTGISSIRESGLKPNPSAVLDEYGRACKALATGEPYELDGHPTDPQSAIDVLRHHILGRMQGL